MGLPEEVRELSLRQQRRSADQPRDALAGRRDRLRNRHGHHRRDAAAPGHIADRLADLAEARVAVREDVALAVPALLCGEDMALGNALDERVSGPAGRHRRQALAYDRLEDAVLEGRGGG